MIALALVAVLAVAGFYVYQNKQNGKTTSSENKQQNSQISNYEECAAAGYTITESYPRQCKTPDGKTFTEDIGNELEKTDLIRLSSPRPGDAVQSPLKVTGEARGFWFNEASFPIKIYDANGKELGTAIAEAKADWMTEEFVPFEATLTFQAPEKGKGVLVLQKDNPSGKKENDDSLKVPVVFGNVGQQTLQSVSLYYYNSSKDEDKSGNVLCSKQGLVSVTRDIAQTSNIIEDTIKLLLKGKLTEAERKLGVTTEFPLAGLELKDGSLDNGVLTLTFNDPQNKTNGGSCRVSVLRDQIEETAKQFPEVKSVKIMPETIFQP